MKSKVKSKATKRLCWYVLHAPNKSWLVCLPSRGAIPFINKARALRFAITNAKTAHAEGALTQVLTQKANGRWQEERTYGKDPKKSKG